MPILKTKLLPPSSARRLIERPRLAARLAELERVRVAVVRAPAGFGKTSLLSQWYHDLRTRDRRAGWISFDPADSDPVEVLAYVVQALESAGHRFAPAVTSLVGPDRFASADAIVTAVVNDLCDAPQPLFLFLDDLHVLVAPGVHAALLAFIERAPDLVHVVIASREVPHIPLARARAFGDAVELTAADLRFSTVETAAFMAHAGAGELDRRQLAQLEGRVEGWVAGLKLAAIALDNDHAPSELLASISGRRWTFAEFFAEVVIAQLGPELTDFLVATSLLDRLCPALCDALTGGTDARRRLDEIEARGLFIFSLDGERKWYRYHHLFAEFLRAELQRRFPERIPQLHARASRWLAAAGLSSDAFTHAIAANDAVLAAQILDERCHTLFYAGQIRVLLDHAAQIPAAVLAEFPRILLAQAWSLILEWKFAEARAILSAVEARLGSPRADGEAARVQALYLHCTMMLAQFEDDMPTVERQCSTLLDGYTDADPYIVGTYYTSLLYAEREQFKLRNYARLDVRARDYFQVAGSRFVMVWHQSIAGPTRFLAGDTSGAVAALEEGLEAATAISGRDSPLASIPALLLAEVHYERNELEAARALLARHLTRAAELGFVDQLVAGYLTSSRLARLSGDVREAERILARGIELAHSRGFRRLVRNIAAESLIQLLRTGERERVLQSAAAHDLPHAAEAVLPGDGPTTGDEATAVAWVALAQADGRTADALRVAAQWQRFAERAGAVRAEIRWATIAAPLLYYGGDARGAERVMRRAVVTAAAGRFIRTLLDMGRLLPLLLGDGAANADAFTRELLTLVKGAADGASGEPAANGVVLSGPLGSREVEIIKLVASGMSNRGIAERLGMTEGTVKWYLHRIFDKVGARRRTQVVEVARRIGIIG